MLKAKPEYIVGRKVEEDNKTKSGFILNEKKKISNVAVVTEIGELVDEVKVGQKIVYEAYTETEVKIGQDEYVIVQVDNVLAILKD